MQALGHIGELIISLVASGDLHHGSKGHLGRVTCGSFICALLECGNQLGDTLQEAIMQNLLIFQSFNTNASLLSLLVDLVLLRSDKRSLVDVGVNFDVRVVAQLERVLGTKLVRGLLF